MIEDNPALVGSLISDSEKRRDAIHVAIAPVTASHDMSPGDRIRFLNDQSDFVAVSDDSIGIVDPFLRCQVKKGDRFYMFLNPGTVTGMRHVWSHPAFTIRTPRVRTDK